MHERETSACARWNREQMLLAVSKLRGTRMRELGQFGILLGWVAICSAVIWGLEQVAAMLGYKGPPELREEVYGEVPVAD